MEVKYNIQLINNNSCIYHINLILFSEDILFLFNKWKNIKLHLDIGESEAEDKYLDCY
jgi:hypothetical protein